MKHKMLGSHGRIPPDGNNGEFICYIYMHMFLDGYAIFFTCLLSDINHNCGGTMGH